MVCLYILVAVDEIDVVRSTVVLLKPPVKLCLGIDRVRYDTRTAEFLLVAGRKEDGSRHSEYICCNSFHNIISNKLTISD